MTSTPQAQQQLRQFSWAGLLVTLIAVAICLRLGFWQLDRAAEKTAYMNAIEYARQQSPCPLVDVLTLESPHLMPAVVTGHFDNRRNVLLDNRMYLQRAGYHVLTPFITEQGQVLLVNRGWLERALERKYLPTIPPIEGPQTLTGHLYQPSAAFVLRHDDPAPDESLLVVQSLDLPSLSEWHGSALLPFEFRIDGETALGEHQESLVRIWQETISSPNTHYGYAIQWFGFGCIALLIFTIASRRRLPPTAPGAPSE